MFIIPFNPFTAKLYIIGIFTHLKLCLADMIHNFKWVKIIQIWQHIGQLQIEHSVVLKTMQEYPPVFWNTFLPVPPLVYPGSLQHLYTIKYKNIQ